MNSMHASPCPLLRWFYDDNDEYHIPSLLPKFLNFSEIKFVPTSETTVQDSLYSEKILLHLFIRLSLLNHFTYFYIRDSFVAIYNTKIMLINNSKDISSVRFQWPPWYFV